MVRRSFSDWISWKEFKETRLTDQRFRERGVYLLAHFRRRPAGKANPDEHGVFYIGETTRQSFMKRLDQFSGAAFAEKPGHSGGSTYYGKFPIKDFPTETLCISILPVPEAEHSSFLIKFLERDLLWKRISKLGAPPKCNRN